MTDLHDQNTAAIVINRVNDAIVTLPNAVLLFTRQLFATVRSGFVRKFLHPSRHLYAVVARQFFECSYCRGLNPKIIVCHDASSLSGHPQTGGPVLSWFFRRLRDLQRLRLNFALLHRSLVPIDCGHRAPLLPVARGGLQDRNILWHVWLNSYTEFRIGAFRRQGVKSP